jgi:imidazolonepropionase-like amidohydrolase
MKIIITLTLMTFIAKSLLAQAPADEMNTYIDYKAPVIAFIHALVVDSKAATSKPNQTVVIENGIIKSVGDDNKIQMPPTAQIIDMTGKALLPGFILMHEHLYRSDFSFSPFYLHVQELPVTFPRMYLACGATTIRTTGSVEPYTDLNLKRDIDAGKFIGPEMDVTAPYLEGKGSFFPGMHELKDGAEAKKFVDFWADQGTTSFKAYQSITKEELGAAIQEAHARKLKITGHLCSVTYREAAEMGIDQLEHGFLAATDFVEGRKENACSFTPNPFGKLTADSPAVKNLIHFLIQKKVTLTSTLAAFADAATLDTTIRPEVLEAMEPDAREVFLTQYNVGRTPAFNQPLLEDMRMEKMFVDQGGLLTVGTDPTSLGGTLAGYGSQRAIELLVQCGFKPLEAIRIATYNGALAMGLDKKIGSIEVGKQADLVVLDADPSQNIHNIEKISIVFKKGIGFDSPKLFNSVKGKVGRY